MIKRYADQVITETWTDEEKFAGWQEVELAVIEAKVRFGFVPRKDFLRIRKILKSTPVDMEWYKAQEKKIHHDLQAWVDERVRHLPVDLQPYFHEGMTSYDTEETVFLVFLKRSSACVCSTCRKLEKALRLLALRYRYSPMMGVTHG